MKIQKSLFTLPDRGSSAVLVVQYITALRLSLGFILSLTQLQMHLNQTKHLQTFQSYFPVLNELTSLYLSYTQSHNREQQFQSIREKMRQSHSHLGDTLICANIGFSACTKEKRKSPFFSSLHSLNARNPTFSKLINTSNSNYLQNFFRVE